MLPSTNLLAVLLAMSVIVCCPKNESPASEKPNILWIYIEDMNPWFGCYGDHTVPTPNVDQLAGEGVLFESCYVPVAVCSPTRSSLVELRCQLKAWVKETDDQGQYPESQENLRRVYEQWKDRFITRYGKPFQEMVTAPEYDFLREDKTGLGDLRSAVPAGSETRAEPAEQLR